MTFAELTLNQTLLDAIIKGGYETPTPIQEKAIPHILKGKDMLGSAQTGTGKTAAFALPIIQKIQDAKRHGDTKHVRALVLAPTRELALQIKDNFVIYSKDIKVRTTAIYGGVPKRKQIQALKRGADVVIATPGRLMDLMNQGVIRLDKVEYFVLDEADRMLDMGFIDDVKKIAKSVPNQRQTMLFSATIPKSIEKLASALLTSPIRVEINPENTPLDTINQSVYFVKRNDKAALLSDILFKEAVTSALVFVRTKHGANDLAKLLNSSGVLTDTIHGNKTQGQRQRTLKSFKQGRVKVLVATDIASRGIDIDDLSHVINYDMPESAETYLHRIGRTARAGKEGVSISFCSPRESHLLKAVQKHIEMRIPVEADHRFKIEKPEKKQNKKPGKKAANGQTPPSNNTKKGKGKGKKSGDFGKFSKNSKKSYESKAKKYKVKRRSYQGK